MAAVPNTLEAFLRATGWVPATETELERMATAFHFFRNRCSPDRLARPAAERGGQNCWAFTVHGVVLNLCAWMQAIDFRRPVGPLELRRGNKLKAFRVAGAAGRATGNWYTTVETPASLLGIYPDQDEAHFYHVKRPTVVLKSVAADVLADWRKSAGKKSTVGRDYHYSHGGGVQYFFPDPGALEQA